MKATVNVKHELDGTVTFSVLIDGEGEVASGDHYSASQACHDIGAAFLLEADCRRGDAEVAAI